MTPELTWYRTVARVEKIDGEWAHCVIPAYDPYNQYCIPVAWLDAPVTVGSRHMIECQLGSPDSMAIGVRPDGRSLSTECSENS